MYTQSKKHHRMPGASSNLIKKVFTFKTLFAALAVAACISLNSCTAFEESYYQPDQVDDEYGPGCKLVNGVIICP